MLTDKQIKLFKKWYGVEPPKCFDITKNTGVFSDKRFVIHVEYGEQLNDAITFVNEILYHSMMFKQVYRPIDLKLNHQRSKTNDIENKKILSLESVGCSIHDMIKQSGSIESMWCSIEDMNPREDLTNLIYSDDDPNKPVTIPKNDHKNFVNGLIRAAFKRTGVGVEMSLGWGVSGKNTTCDIIHKGEKYSADAKKHPRDIDNEYIGKSLSFKRAYAALVAGINGVKRHDAIEFAPHEIEEGAYGVVSIDGYPHICKAGAHIKRMQSVTACEDGCILPTERTVYTHSTPQLQVKPQKEEIKQRFRVVEDTIK